MNINIKTQNKIKSLSDVERNSRNCGCSSTTVMDEKLTQHKTQRWSIHHTHTHTKRIHRTKRKSIQSTLRRSNMMLTRSGTQRKSRTHLLKGSWFSQRFSGTKGPDQRNGAHQSEGTKWKRKNCPSWPPHATHVSSGTRLLVASEKIRRLEPFSPRRLKGTDFRDFVTSRGWKCWSPGRRFQLNAVQTCRFN